MRVTGGAMLRARVLAALLRIRPKPNFHRNNDRNLGGGMQGCARCELFGFFACSGRLLGAVEFEALLRGQGKKSKPAPFTQRRVRHPREFQSCFKWIPVPRGRIGHPPVGVLHSAPPTCCMPVDQIGPFRYNTL